MSTRKIMAFILAALVAGAVLGSFSIANADSKPAYVSSVTAASAAGLKPANGTCDRAADRTCPSGVECANGGERSQAGSCGELGACDASGARAPKQMAGCPGGGGACDSCSSGTAQ